MTILLRLRRDLFDAVHADLHRPHRFADERVGFLYGPIALLSARCALVLPTRYEPVPDEDYLDDPTVGACINTDAMRRAVRTTHASGACCFHVHVHDHNGAPYPSGVDQALVRRFMPALHAVAPAARHGGIVLSRDAATTIVWSHTTQQLEHARVSIVGAPMWIGAGERDGTHG